MTVFFVGAMPWVQLFDGDRRTGWAAAIRCDWSPRGSGAFVCALVGDRWRIAGTDERLLEWLWGWYLRPAMRSEGEPSEYEPMRHAEPRLMTDLETGFTATAGGVSIEISEPLERQLVRRERYPLDDFEPTASWVRTCCRIGRIEIDGRSVGGEPSAGTDSVGLRTSAQINEAEVWTATTPP